jgi:hypothetical protein
MKNHVVFLLNCLLVLILVACKKDVIDYNSSFSQDKVYSCTGVYGKSYSNFSGPEKLQVSSLTDHALSKIFLDSLRAYSAVLTETIPELKDFDFNRASIFLSSLKNEESVGLGMNLIFSERKSITFMLRLSQGKFYNPTLVVIEKRKKIICYDLVEKTKSGIILSDDTSKTGHFVTYLQPGIFYRGCGQAIMDCVNHAFSANGWASVWLTIQSLWLPQTVVAIIAACGAKNCL